MINDNELRKGNWVIFDNTNKRHPQQHHVKVLELKEKEVVVLDPVGLQLSLFYQTNSIRPIPLTPEVLEKCGFKYNKVAGVAQLSDDFEEPEGDTEYWELGKLVIVSWNKGPYTLSNKSSFDHRIELKSLHQLQNIHFVFAETELEYKP